LHGQHLGCAYKLPAAACRAPLLEPELTSDGVEQVPPLNPSCRQTTWKPGHFRGLSECPTHPCAQISKATAQLTVARARPPEPPFAELPGHHKTEAARASEFLRSRTVKDSPVESSHTEAPPTGEPTVISRVPYEVL
jgi:hypothetical protein